MQAAMLVLVMLSVMQMFMEMKHNEPNVHVHEKHVHEEEDPRWWMLAQQSRDTEANLVNNAPAVAHEAPNLPVIGKSLVGSAERRHRHTIAALNIRHGGAV